MGVGFNGSADSRELVDGACYRNSEVGWTVTGSGGWIGWS